jgi:translocator protein
MGMRDVLIFLGFLVVAFAVAGVGGLATAPGVRDWYPSLNKPSWTPPAWLFGPVWTVLYLCIAVAGFLAWRQSGFGGAKWAMRLFAVQLVLNVAWSWVFFYLRQPGWGFTEIVLLWAVILATTVAFFNITAWSGLLFVPYLLWVTFAACLNLAIWRLNPASGG